jgi:hypothetical protein
LSVPLPARVGEVKGLRLPNTPLLVRPAASILEPLTAYTNAKLLPAATVVPVPPLPPLPPPEGRAHGLFPGTPPEPPLLVPPVEPDPPVGHELAPPQPKEAKQILISANRNPILEDFILASRIGRHRIAICVPAGRLRACTAFKARFTRGEQKYAAMLGEYVIG